MIDILNVSKPGRYIGNEINMVKKDTEGKIRFAYCFPDVYEVGMSHLGLQILYFFLNRRDDVYCERAFMPWTDMPDLFALETGEPLKNFDFLGFTLQHEMSYTNVLAMLDMAGLPLRAADRGEDAPIVCAGGPAACNPEPMAEFVDFFCIGDGEAILDQLMDIYAKGGYMKGFCNGNNNVGNVSGKREFLKSIAHLPGIYVPAFYKPEYGNDGTLKSFGPINDAPEALKQAPTIKKAQVQNLDETFFPDKLLVPLIECAHHRVTLELFRGCKRGCKFCQAGNIGKPIRYRKPETLLAQAEKLLDSTGHEEISLLSLSTSDYPYFEKLLEGLLEITKERKVNISLPSLRVDAVSVAAMQKTQAVRKSSLTFAPEAGTQRLRDYIGKDISDADITAGCRSAFEAGFDRVKLYFMSGLPSETEEDAEAIADLAQTIVDEYYKLPKEKRGRPVSVNVSCSCFVPKPFTPFQREAQDTAEDFIQRQRMVKSKLSSNRKISYRYHDAQTAVLEGVLARGDRRVGNAIEKAYRLGARFDSWTELFRFDLWEQAFEETGISPNFYAHRLRPAEELLPWDFISS